MQQFLQFTYCQRDDLHTYTIVAGDEETPGPVWPGLYQPFPEDRHLNPYWRHGINNYDGEALAVWRAVAWAITAGSHRFAIPVYYRDEAAALLGRSGATTMVRWEYRVDIEQSDPIVADRGFVPARACITFRPGGDQWQREHQGLAGLFAVRSFSELTALDLAVGNDARSEITLFGLGGGSAGAPCFDALRDALNRRDRPHLAEILRAGEVFVDLTIARDRFVGNTSYLTVKTVEPAHELVFGLADHYRNAYHRYVTRVDQLRSLADFHDAIEDLLTPPPCQVQDSTR